MLEDYKNLINLHIELTQKIRMESLFMINLRTVKILFIVLKKNFMSVTGVSNTTHLTLMLTVIIVIDQPFVWIFL